MDTRQQESDWRRWWTQGAVSHRANPHVAFFLAVFLVLIQWLLAYIAVIVWLSPDAGVDPWVSGGDQR